MKRIKNDNWVQRQWKKLKMKLGWTPLAILDEVTDPKIKDAIMDGFNASENFVGIDPGDRTPRCLVCHKPIDIDQKKNIFIDEYRWVHVACVEEVTKSIKEALITVSQMLVSALEPLILPMKALGLEDFSDEKILNFKMFIKEWDKQNELCPHAKIRIRSDETPAQQKICPDCNWYCMEDMDKFEEEEPQYCDGPRPIPTYCKEQEAESDE